MPLPNGVTAQQYLTLLQTRQARLNAEIARVEALLAARTLAERTAVAAELTGTEA